MRSLSFFQVFHEKNLYIWADLCYHQKAGVKPDDITMPLAQLREKAVFDPVHHPPLLGYREIGQALKMDFQTDSEEF